ncbi:F-box/LRR-repeat protein 12 [Porphyrio hochstetteri]
MGVEPPALPDSVLLKVLALLPLRDRLRATRVCRRWQRLALDGSVWRHVDLSPHRLTPQTLWSLVRHRLGDSLRTLRLRGALRCGAGRRRRLLSPALLGALEKRCPRLQRLCLAETDLRPVPYESIPSSLTALELSCCEIPAAWFCGGAAKAPPRLRHLVIRDVPAFSDRHLLSVSSSCRLRTLSLWGTYRLTDGGVQRAAPHLGELHRLELRRCGVGAAALGAIGRHGKGLRFLEVRGSSSLTEAALAAVGTLQSLETLSLDLGEEVSGGAVASLCRALPRLRSLRLGGAPVPGPVLQELREALPCCSLSQAP